MYSVHIVRFGEVGHAVVGWRVEHCEATTWASYIDAYAPHAHNRSHDSWSRTEPQVGMGAMQANLTGLSPGRRYTLFIEGTGGSCGSGQVQGGQTCFQTPPRPVGCYEPVQSTPPQTTGSLTRPIGYDAVVHGVGRGAANITWGGPSCGYTQVKGGIHRPGDTFHAPRFWTFASPVFDGPGPHTYTLTGLDRRDEVSFRVHECTHDHVSFCFLVLDHASACAAGGHTIAPLSSSPATWGASTATDLVTQLQTRPAFAIGAGLAVAILLGLGRIRSRLP